MMMVFLTAAAVAVILPTFGRLGQRCKAPHIIINLVNFVIIIAARVRPTAAAAIFRPSGGGGSS
jgi:hypothetical protein